MPVPSQPTIGLATAVGATSAAVNYTAPSDTGGLPILSYTATATPTSGGATVSATLSQAGSGSIYVTGLTPNTSYTFTVRATNLDGNSVDSAASNSTTTTPSRLFPAADFCNNLVIGPNDDWYLPSKNELEIAYFNLKPSTANNQTSSGIDNNAVPPRSSNYTSTVPGRTSASAFQSSGTEAFNSNAGTYYWTSTETAAGTALTQTFNTGEQISNNKITTALVRAVRRAPIPAGFTVPSAPTLGTVTLSGNTATIPYNPPLSNGNCVISGYEAMSTVNSSLKGSASGPAAGSIAISGLTLGVSHTFTVRARNLIGIGAQSTPSNSVVLTAPLNTGVPVITGTVQIGQAVSVSNGTWSGTPVLVYTYQWQRGLTTTSYNDITGATNSSYTLVNADFNNFLRCRVTATNNGGNASQFTADTAKVTALPPSNTGLPIISGTAIFGNTLTVSNGTWDGIPAPTFSYQWQRGTTNITGATNSSYTVVMDDTLNTLRCVVTATNAGGSVQQATSNIPLTGVIPAVAPSNTLAPAITGTVFIGQTLTTSDGTWTGTATITFTYQWQRGTTDIAGATNKTYAVQFIDYNNTLRCIVTAKNPANNTTGVSKESANTIIVPPAPPVNTALPIISGDVRVTSTLSCTTGTWTGTETILYTYQWQRGTTNITGATNSTYVVDLLDVGSTLRCVVTARNPATSTGVTANSANTIIVPVAPPRNDALPVVSVSAAGPHVSGGYASTLTVTNGTWFGTAPIVFSYQWQRGTTNIPGATSNTYVIQIDDTANTVRCVVTGTNSAASTPATSADFPATGSIPTFAPLNTVKPLITGTATNNNTLTVSTGTWVGTAPISYSYQWQRGTTDIPGATNNSYLVTIADTLNTLRCRVTATNVANTSGVQEFTLNVPSTGVIPAVGPSNTVRPTISGTAIINNTLTADPGTWTGTATINYSYQWRKGTAGATSPIPGATNNTYTIVLGDKFNVIDVLVTASNPGGTASRESLTTDSIPDAVPPVNTVAPVISGTVAYNNILTVSNGTWTGTAPITYTYQWQRGTTDIVGATAQNYTLGVTDTLNTVRCVVTARNPATTVGVAKESASVPSSGTIPAIAPFNTVQPTISGSVVIKNTVEAMPNTWVGSGTVTFEYQWLRAGANITGATNKTYEVAAADYNTKLSVRVTAKNVASTTGVSATTLESVTVPAYKTVFDAPGPQITGTVAIGNTLGVNLGTYLGVPSPTITYQWQADATNISGATGANYTLTGSEYNKQIRCVVTATNLGGTTVVNTNTTVAVPPKAPNIITNPAISGTVAIEQTITCSTGTWDATPTPSYNYQWRAGTTLVGTDSPNYTIAFADFNKTISCTVTATNLGGNGAATSAATSAVPGYAPVLQTPAPVTSGTMQVFQTISVTGGTWKATPTIGYAYQWQRNGANINTLPATKVDQGASNSYTLTAADYGASIRVIIYAFNTGGETATTVNFSGTVAGIVPANTAVPVINGIVAPAQTITVTDGTWNAVPNISSYSYQWTKGSTNLGTGNSYLITLADIGSKIKCTVTATNAVGSTSAISAETITVPNATAPSNTAVPTITGTATISSTLTSNTGSWNGTPPITYAIEWFRDPADGSGVLGTGPNYTITMADTGRKVYSRVTATNPGGTQVQNSASVPSSGTIPSIVPSNTALPVISGTATYGSTLTVTNGTWTGTTPIGYAIQWQRGTTNIAGATGSTYTLTYDDTNTTVRAIVTASNGAGSVSANSANYPASGLVPGVAPISVTAPTLSASSIRVGDTINVTSNGTWTGTPGFSFTYQWTSDGSNLAGAISSALVVPTNAYNTTLRCVVTATNAAGSTPITVGSILVLNQLMVLAGDGEPDLTNSSGVSLRLGITPVQTPRVYNLVNIIAPSFSAVYPTPTITYTIKRSLPSTPLTEITVTTSATSSYNIPTDAYLHNLIIEATANNGIESKTYRRKCVVVYDAPLVNTVAPSLTLSSGTLIPGGVLSYNAGTYSGFPSISSTSVTLERRISGATTTVSSFSTQTGSYTLTNADYNADLRITVSVSNGITTATANSQYTGLVGPLPIVNTAIPTITATNTTVVAGVQKFGRTFTISTGTWTGWPALDYTITLYRVNSSNVATQVTSLQATSQTSTLTYQLENADFNCSHYAQVLAKNSANTTGVTANSTTIAVYSTPTGYVGADPFITASGFDPAVTLRVGQVVRVDQPTYTVLPTPSISYQWRRGTTNISGANSSTYTTTSADLGSTINCVVTYGFSAYILNTPTTITKTTGSTTAVLDPLSAPSWTVNPGNLATPTVGQGAGTNVAVLPSQGTIAGNPTPTVSYVWQKRTIANPSLTTVQTGGGNLALTASDYGAELRVAWAITNSQGSATYTTPVVVVAGQAPAAGAYSISITSNNLTRIGDTITFSVSKVASATYGTPTPSFSGQLVSYDFDSNNTPRGINASTRSIITSFTQTDDSTSGNVFKANTYTIPASMYGKWIAYEVTATNAIGSQSYFNQTQTNVVYYGVQPAITYTWSSPSTAQSSSFARVGDTLGFNLGNSAVPSLIQTTYTSSTDQRVNSSTAFSALANPTSALPATLLNYELRGGMTVTTSALAYKIWNGITVGSLQTQPPVIVTQYTSIIKVRDVALVITTPLPSITGNFVAGSSHSINIGAVPTGWKTVSLVLNMSPGTSVTFVNNATTLASPTYFWTATVGTITNITATWSNGSSPAESWTNVATLNQAIAAGTVPGAPTGISVSVTGSTTATASWNAPSNNGGVPISSYSIQVYNTSNTLVTTVTSSSLSVGLTGLTRYTTYYVKVAATNSVGTGPYSSQSANFTTLPDAPTAPTNVTVSNVTSSGCTVSWTAPSDSGGAPITGSIVYVKLVSNNMIVAFDNTADASTTKVITGLGRVTTYNAQVLAANGTYSSPLSTKSANFTTVPTVPNAPTNPTASNATANGFTASWTAPSDNGGASITSYSLYIGALFGSVVTNSSATSFVVTGLGKGVSTGFNVTAINSAGYGATSGISNNITTLTTVPGAPTSFSANRSLLDLPWASCSWTAPADNGGSAITKYQIMSGGVVVAETTSTSVTIQNLTAGANYAYRVRAVNAVGTSAVSNESSVTIGFRPSVPTGLTIDVLTLTSVRISWTAPANNGFAITGYKMTGPGFTANQLITQAATVIDRTGLTTGANLTYEVKAVNSVGDSDAAIATQLLAQVPSGPFSFAGTMLDTLGSCKFTWTAPANNGSAITGYFFNFPAGNQSITLSGSTFEHTVVGFGGGTTQKFQLTAINAKGSSAVAELTVTFPNVPGLPDSITATVTGQTTATVTWTQSSTLHAGALTGSPVTKFHLYRKTGGVDTFIAETNVLTTTYAVTGLTASTTYEFWVAAGNRHGFSAPRVSSAVTTQSALAAPNSIAYATPGTYSVVVPAGIPKVKMFGIGAGGGGGGGTARIAPATQGSFSTGGGGASAEARAIVYPVTQGETIYITVGSAGAGGGARDGPYSGGSSGGNGTHSAIAYGSATAYILWCAGGYGGQVSQMGSNALGGLRTWSNGNELGGPANSLLYTTGETPGRQGIMNNNFQQIAGGVGGNGYDMANVANTNIVNHNLASNGVGGKGNCYPSSTGARNIGYSYSQQTPSDAGISGYGGGGGGGGMSSAAFVYTDTGLNGRAGAHGAIFLSWHHS